MKIANSADMAAFTAWCVSTGRCPLPATPETVTEYTVHLTVTRNLRTGRLLSPRSIEGRLAAIRTAHKGAGLAAPETKTAREVLAEYRERLASAKAPAARTRRAVAVVPAKVFTMLATLDRDTLIGKRDAALLLLGWAAAARVSELVALDIDDLTETEQGLDIHIYRRKLKQFIHSAIPYGSNPATCPVRAVRALVDALAKDDPEHCNVGRTSGPLFVRINRHGRIAPPVYRKGRPIGDPNGRMTADTAADAVERAAYAARLNGQRTGHSLRRGFATTARRSDADLERIVRHGGCSSPTPRQPATMADTDFIMRHRDN
ncbi:tyrosine-type recombinase/integrase [Streptomyces mirabilis]